MTIGEIIKHRVDKDAEVFYLVDTRVGGAVNLSLEFEKKQIRFNLFDSREAADAFRNLLAETEYSRVIEPQDLAILSMPLSEYIREYEYDA